MSITHQTAASLRKVEFVASVSVDENDTVILADPALCRFLGKPVHDLAQYVERTTGAYREDGIDVPSR